MQDRVQLRRLFDQDALLYHEASPDYPAALFDDVVKLSDIPTHGRILEIGCGTGQATLPLAQRGYRILCVELGANLAAVARHNVAPYPQVDIHVGAFEEWPVEEGAFDLVLSATAFHWIDPIISYQKSAQALKPSGALALCWHVHVQSAASQGFFEAVQEVYRREAPVLVQNRRSLTWSDQITHPVKTDIESTGLFGEVTICHYGRDVTYDTTSYLRLLNTYSDHTALEEQQRNLLFQGIAAMIDTHYSGHITKGYLAVLYVAKRK